MKKLLENATVRLTSYEKSPFAKLLVSKAPKALLALAITTGSTALATGIVPVNVNVAGNEVSNIQEANAWGAAHEHRFAYIGPWKSQAQGNGECWQKYRELPTRTHWSYNWFGVSRSFYVKLAWDGKNIFHPWHVWYHRSQGVCVANK